MKKNKYTLWGGSKEWHRAQKPVLGSIKSPIPIYIKTKKIKKKKK